MAVTGSSSSDVSPGLVRGLEICDLAAALFASPLQASDHPSPHAVHAAILEVIQVCGGDCGPCVARVAQEAGDHPETYVRRMRWSLRTVEDVYASSDLVA
jgi:hypothetical protein